ncbi:hypothetical protein RHMOL_Rhmol05G0162000 [Rhododendron molle]|uniref:Uncharacterized protein n=1 Tax=Rhododendron molle TaxID=49168 RepID=A0ACC0NPU6_RHOML|nr:hypothetical protein RHMOL_Rhmol05G0162000 [Rhododendron molle]
MSNYNWSQAILDSLMKSVEAYATKPKDVAGCVMLLLLLNGSLQQTDREVRVFRTLRNRQTTSNIIHEISKHDDNGGSPENDDEHDNESQDDDHGTNDNDNESQRGNPTSESRSPMTGNPTLNLLSETASIEQPLSLVYKRRAKTAGTESQKEEQSSLKDQLVTSTEPEQPSCLFLDSRSTLQGETPAIEKPSGLYLDSRITLQAEEAELNGTESQEEERSRLKEKIEELQREIDDERALMEKEMEKN